MADNEEDTTREKVPHWSDPAYMDYMLELEKDGHFDRLSVLKDAEAERSRRGMTFDAYAKNQTFM